MFQPLILQKSILYVKYRYAAFFGYMSGTNSITNSNDVTCHWALS